MYYLLEYAYGELDKNSTYHVIDCDDLVIEQVSYRELEKVVTVLEARDTSFLFPSLYKNKDGVLEYYSCNGTTMFWNSVTFIDDIGCGMTWLKLGDKSWDFICKSDIDTAGYSVVNLGNKMFLYGVLGGSTPMLYALYKHRGYIIARVSISNVYYNLFFDKMYNYVGFVIVVNGKIEKASFDNSDDAFLARIKLLDEYYLMVE